MQLALTLWGNSLGIRIPKSLREALFLKPGSKVEAKVSHGRIVLEPLDHAKKLEKMAGQIDLKELMKKVTPQNRPQEIGFDQRVGKEIW